jgi:hypothetical protein
LAREEEANVQLKFSEKAEGFGLETGHEEFLGWVRKQGNKNNDDATVTVERSLTC